MAMTTETLDRAKAYAQEMRDIGKPATVVALSTRTNAYEEWDRRATELRVHAVDTVNANGWRTLVIWHEGLKDAESAFYLIDDGRTTEAFYVTGWSNQLGAMFVSPLPLNYDADGNRAQRADNDGPVDFSTHRLAPRRAYHVKLSRNIPALAGFNNVTHATT